MKYHNKITAVILSAVIGCSAAGVTCMGDLENISQYDSLALSDIDSGVYSVTLGKTKIFTLKMAGISKIGAVSSDKSVAKVTALSYKRSTVKVTVKPYTNPVKSVNVFGAKVNNSTNLKNLTKNWRNAFVDLDGAQKSKTVKVVAAKGWKVASIGIWPSSNEYPDFNKWSGGGYKGTRTLKAKLPGEGSYCVSVDMYNPKWDSVINVQYFVYY